MTKLTDKEIEEKFNQIGENCKVAHELLTTLLHDSLEILPKTNKAIQKLWKNIDTFAGIRSSLENELGNKTRLDCTGLFFGPVIKEEEK